MTRCWLLWGCGISKKCPGKMGDVAEERRTVLFVSHNIGAVRQLCSSIMLLDHGRVVGTGSVGSLIDQYLRGISAIDSSSPDTSTKILRTIEFIDSSSRKADSILAGSGGSLRVHYERDQCCLLISRIMVRM